MTCRSVSPHSANLPFFCEAGLMNFYNANPGSLLSHRPKRTPMTSIFHLPWELLVVIFELALLAEHADSRRQRAIGTWRLSFVCRQWRSIVHGSPWLWAIILLQAPSASRQSPNMHHRPSRLIQLHLHLAGGRPLTIRVTGQLREDEDCADPFFSSAVDDLLWYRHLWRQATLHGALYDIHHLLRKPRSSTLRVPYPVLEGITLMHWTPTEGRKDGNPRSTMHDWEALLVGCPRLSRFVIQMPWDLDQAIFVASVLYIWWNTTCNFELDLSDNHVIMTLNDDPRSGGTSNLPAPRAAWVTLAATRHFDPRNPSINTNRGVLAYGNPYTAECPGLNGNSKHLSRTDPTPRAGRLFKRRQYDKLQMFLLSSFSLILNRGPAAVLEEMASTWIRALVLSELQHLTLSLGAKSRPLDLPAPLKTLHGWKSRTQTAITTLTIRTEASAEGMEYVVPRFVHLQTLYLLHTPHCSKVLQSLATSPLPCPQLSRIYLQNPTSLDASSINQFIRARQRSQYGAPIRTIWITRGSVRDEALLQEHVAQGTVRFTRLSRR
ncbi:hypothetical protein BDV98DRAFT_607059 [Pterulicium gracile]|uniref:Uncharacterized protein n=1 Tax=Pterulicium gracile TaxID=1884261 RepID=A0A5C3Q861_9AGAR|nr:hypothetical protein BDV98DRAFT_607059 [Pterula gracilis]